MNPPAESSQHRPLRELLDPVSLTDARGQLDPAAVGWSRRPLVDTSGIGPGRGRNKRWEYWGITSPSHVLAVTVSSLDYASVCEIFVLDRRTSHTSGRAVTLLPSRGVRLPANLGDEPAGARVDGLAIDIEESAAGTVIRANDGAELAFEVLATRPARHEALAVVVPWSRRRFQYTVKDVARPVTGWVRVGSATAELDPADSWAVLDHGRGRWPYAMTWNWGAGSGWVDGQPVGLQVGGRWTEGTGSTENAMLIEGRLHHLPEELTWDYDLHHDSSPWRVHGGGLDATFTPFHVKRARTELGVLANRTHQAFGVWHGHVDIGDRRQEFAGLTGWAEEVSNRW